MFLKGVCVCVLEESLSILFHECNNATCENVGSPISSVALSLIHYF